MNAKPSFIFSGRTGTPKRIHCTTVTYRKTDLDVCYTRNDRTAHLSDWCPEAQVREVTLHGVDVKPLLDESAIEALAMAIDEQLTGELEPQTTLDQGDVL